MGFQQHETSPLLGKEDITAPAPPRHVPPKYIGYGKGKHRFFKLLIVALAVTAVLCILLAIWDKEEWKPAPLPPNEPVHDTPRLPADSDGYPVRFPHEMCKPDASYRVSTNSFAVSFSPEKSVSITERMHRRGVHHGMRLGVYGHLAVRPYRDDNDDNDDTGMGQITVDISSNLPTLDQDIELVFSASSQHLELELPREVDWQEDMMPCAIVNITLWAPSTPSSLRSLDANVVHLDVLLAETLALDVENMRLHTVVGDVDAASSSRDGIDSTRKKQGQLGEQPNAMSARPMPASYKLVPRAASSAGTVSGDIKGPFYLGEKLDLRTTNGDVSVSVTPLDVAAKGEMHVRTVSGDITVEEEGVPRNGDGKKEIPRRNYETTMQTTSGDISARVAFGSVGSFETTSGDMTLELLPVVVVDDGRRAGRWMSLFTGTQSGDSNTEVLEPVFYNPSGRRMVVDSSHGYFYQIRVPEDYLDGSEEEEGGEEDSVDSEGGGEGFGQLASRHRATSGNIKLTYPESWEGFVQLATRVGDITAEGKRLRIIKKQMNPGWGKVVEAVNGVDSPGEGSSVHANCVSGDVEFCVGKGC